MRSLVTLACLAACGGNTGVASPGIDSSLDPAPLPAGAIDVRGLAYEAGIPLAKPSSAFGFPVAGAQLCSEALPTNTCIVTGSDGLYSIELDNVMNAGTDVPFAVTATANGHVTTSGLGYSKAENGGWQINYPEQLAMFDDARASSFFGAAGFPYPPVQTGFIRVEVSELLVAKQIEGATVTLAAGSPANGPVYFDVGSDGSEIPNPTLTATGSDGHALFGDVPPGDFSITVTVAGMTCSDNGFAWPGRDGASASGHLDSEAFTDAVRVFCR